MVINLTAFTSPFFFPSVFDLNGKKLCINTTNAIDIYKYTTFGLKEPVHILYTTGQTSLQVWHKVLYTLVTYAHPEKESEKREYSTIPWYFMLFKSTFLRLPQFD